MIDRQRKCGPYSIDGVIGSLAIEFDGNYWHSLPRVAESDSRKDLFLRHRGFTVVRIPEKLYKEDRPAAIGLVREALACMSN
jgi:very-short-patch-repair endonuclease